MRPDQGSEVEIAWDFSAFPVWADTKAIERLSPGLTSDLQRWSDEMSTLLWGIDGPHLNPKVDPVELDRLADEGRLLARRVRTALGPQFSVTYRNEATQRREDVSSLDFS